MAVVHELVPVSFPRAQLFSSGRFHSASCGGGCTSMRACRFSSSVCCVPAASESANRRVSSIPFEVRKMIVEKLWREFFSDPSQWWDRRSEKVHPRYPDFTHKKTRQPLWLDDSLNPPWVEVELAAMALQPRRSHIFSWNVRLRRHVTAGAYKKTMELFRQMQRKGIILDKYTFVPVLNACSRLKSLEDGRRVHKQIIHGGCESDPHVATCLVDMYAKCGSIQDAWTVFNKMREHSMFSWTAIIGAYVKSGEGEKAMELFRQMQREGVEPDEFTFVGALNACACIAALEEGRLLHEQIIQRGYESNVYVANCLVDMYAKCGSIVDALTVFNRMRERCVISWSAMISGYVKSGQGGKAMELYLKMQQEGVEPNEFTFLGVLNACASLAALEEGRRVHEQIIQRGSESDIYVANCLVDMYAKCGSIEDAWSVFNKMQRHDLVSWNAIIGGYVKSKQGLKALELFRQMQQESVDPDAITFIGVLNACASVAALEEGKRVHARVIQRGCESDVHVATCLVDMYANCGSIEDAWSVFNNMQERNVVSWSAMIGGYAMHGYAKKAIELFKWMVKEGVEIDEITLICLLSACSHGGLVKEGLRYFKSMDSCYNLLRTVEHYSCMVDLLGRAGWLEEAQEILLRMPVEKDTSLWISLLGACRIHGNIEMAERAAKQCWKLDPENDSGHVLLSNVYAAGKLGKGAAFQEERLEVERKLWKEQVQTYIEVNNVVHLFIGNEDHPQIQEILAELERLSLQMNEAGYIQDPNLYYPEEKTGSDLIPKLRR